MSYTECATRFPRCTRVPLGLVCLIELIGTCCELFCLMPCCSTTPYTSLQEYAGDRWSCSARHFRRFVVAATVVRNLLAVYASELSLPVGTSPAQLLELVPHLNVAMPFSEWQVRAVRDAVGNAPDCGRLQALLWKAALVRTNGVCMGPLQRPTYQLIKAISQG